MNQEAQAGNQRKHFPCYWNRERKRCNPLEGRKIKSAGSADCGGPHVTQVHLLRPCRVVVAKSRQEIADGCLEFSKWLGIEQIVEVVVSVEILAVVNSVVELDRELMSIRVFIGNRLKDVRIRGTVG